MKFIILVTVLISAFSNVSFAGEVCGTLGTHTVAPQCAAGEICPMWLKLQYDITTAEGTRYDLQTSNITVLNNFGQFNGSDVCVSGSQAGDSFEVSSIAAQ